MFPSIFASLLFFWICALTPPSTTQKYFRHIRTDDLGMLSFADPVPARDTARAHLVRCTYDSLGRIIKIECLSVGRPEDNHDAKFATQYIQYDPERRYSYTARGEQIGGPGPSSIIVKAPNKLVGTIWGADSQMDFEGSAGRKRSVIRWRSDGSIQSIITRNSEGGIDSAVYDTSSRLVSMFRIFSTHRPPSSSAKEAGVLDSIVCFGTFEYGPSSAPTLITQPAISHRIPAISAKITYDSLGYTHRTTVNMEMLGESMRSVDLLTQYDRCGNLVRDEKDHELRLLEWDSLNRPVRSVTIRLANGDTSERSDTHYESTGYYDIATTTTVHLYGGGQPGDSSVTREVFDPLGRKVRSRERNAQPSDEELFTYVHGDQPVQLSTSAQIPDPPAFDEEILMDTPRMHGQNEEDASVTQVTHSVPHGPARYFRHMDWRPDESFAFTDEVVGSDTTQLLGYCCRYDNEGRLISWSYGCGGHLQNDPTSNLAHATITYDSSTIFFELYRSYAGRLSTWRHRDAHFASDHRSAELICSECNQRAEWRLDSLGRVVESWDAGTPAHPTNSQGHAERTIYTYDTQGRLRTCHYRRYDYDAKKWDGLVLIDSIIYDGLGRCSSIVSPSSDSLFMYSYDSLGYRTQRSASSISDSRSPSVQSFLYDRNGRLLRYEDRNTQRWNGFDRTGRLLFEVTRTADSEFDSIAYRYVDQHWWTLKIVEHYRRTANNPFQLVETKRFRISGSGEEERYELVTEDIAQFVLDTSALLAESNPQMSAMGSEVNSPGVEAQKLVEEDPVVLAAPDPEPVPAQAPVAGASHDVVMTEESEIAEEEAVPIRISPDKQHWMQTVPGSYALLDDDRIFADISFARTSATMEELTNSYRYDAPAHVDVEPTRNVRMIGKHSVTQLEWTKEKLTYRRLITPIPKGYVLLTFEGPTESLTKHRKIMDALLQTVVNAGSD